MSENKNEMTQTQAARIIANAQVLNSFVRQLFTDPSIVTGGAADSGGHDELMMSNIPAEILVPLLGLQAIADADKRNDIELFVNRVLRGSKGIGGFASKMGENIAIGMTSGGGSSRKIVKKPNVLSRSFTNRGWRKKAEEEGAQIIE